MNHNLLDALAHIARLAGDAILQVYESDFTAENKADSSPVTEADLRADHVIRAGLEIHCPGVFIWSEESKSELGSNHEPDVFFLVDPLDGTREFIKRNGEFTVNIARVEHGQVTHAVVFVPVTGEMFYAARGVGAFKQVGQEPPVRLQCAVANLPPLGAALRVVMSRSHSTPEQEAWLQAHIPQAECVSYGSSLKFCRLAEGLADVYPRLGPTSQWDTAAAQGILECAGGVVLDLQGNSLQYGFDKPVLNPHFVALANPLLKNRVFGESF